MDCDGVPTADDCDDSDSTDASLSGDCDQDGVLTAEDCDDSIDTMPLNDADCDGMLTVYDCDDTNANLDSNYSIDSDCDGFYDDYVNLISSGGYHSCGINQQSQQMGF